MHPQTVKEWKARYDAHNLFVLEEARNRTVAERYQRLLGFVTSLSKLGLLKPREDDLEFHLRWQKARECMREKRT